MINIFHFVVFFVSGGYVCMSCSVPVYYVGLENIARVYGIILMGSMVGLVGIGLFGGKSNPRQAKQWHKL